MRAGTWPVLAATGRTTRLPFTAPPTLLTAHEPLSPESATPASGPTCQSRLGARRGTCASMAVCTVTVHATQAAPASPARSRPRGLAISFLFLSPQDVTPSARSRHSTLNPTCFLSPASLQGHEPAPSGERTQDTVVETVKEKACIPEHGLRGPGSRVRPQRETPLLIPPSTPCWGPTRNGSSALFRIFRPSNFITSA